MHAAATKIGDRPTSHGHADDSAAPASDIAGGIAGGVMEFQASSLRGTGQYFQQLSAKHREWARNADPGVIGKTRWYADIDAANRAGRSADALVRSCTRRRSPG